MIRILFCVDCFTAGGKERRLLELMKGLKKDPQIDFELILMDSNIEYKEVFDLGINIHYVVRKTKKDLSVFNRIYKICKNYRPDMVHTWDSMTSVYLIPTVKLLKIRFINGMITDAPGKVGISNKTWIRGQISFPFSNLIIGNSRAGLQAYNAPASKSICIHNGFNFDRVRVLKPGNEIREKFGIKTKYIVGMIASFSKFKDYKTYFTAAALILEKRQDVTFLAIGNNTDSEESKDLVDKKYIDYIKLLGRSEEVESLIAALDITALATFTEGISNSILESMALGKAVVSTSCDGTKELVEDKKTGFLVSPSDPVEMAEKMEILLNDDSLRISMGNLGKQRVLTHFSIDKMVNDFIANYKKQISFH